MVSFYCFVDSGSLSTMPVIWTVSYGPATILLLRVTLAIVDYLPLLILKIRK